MHLPNWLNGPFFAGLTAEQRTHSGWENPARRRNEPFDQMDYVLALWIYKRGEKVPRDSPPL